MEAVQLGSDPLAHTASAPAPASVLHGSASRRLPEPQLPEPQLPEPQLPEPPGMTDLVGWLQHSIGLHPTDALRCARPLFEDGCRCVDDVGLLVELDDLSREVPKVMRYKIARAFRQSTTARVSIQVAFD